MATITVDDKPAAGDKLAWFSRRGAARMLGVAPQLIPRIAEAGGIRLKLLPGCRPLYSRADVERLAREAVGTAEGQGGAA